MLTILELVFCIILLVLIIQLIKRRCNPYREDQVNHNRTAQAHRDLERFRQARSNRTDRTYQSTAAVNIEERRVLVRKNLFTRTISGEKSVLDLARLLAISRGADVVADEEMGCSPSRDDSKATAIKGDAVESRVGHDELALNNTISDMAEPSAPQREPSATHVKDATSQEQPVVNTSSEEETPSIRDLITNLTKNVTRRLSHTQNVEEKHLECSICLEEFNPGDSIGWAKDGGDATPISNEGFADTGCDHIFHQDCLLSWLELHDDCPLCRRKVVHANADVRFAGWEDM